MTARIQPLPTEHASADALLQAAATITAALIARATGPVDQNWISSAFAEVYAGLLTSPPRIADAYSMASKQ